MNNKDIELRIEKLEKENKELKEILFKATLSAVSSLSIQEINNHANQIEEQNILNFLKLLFNTLEGNKELIRHSSDYMQQNMIIKHY